MPVYSAPGVYVQELAGGPRPITAGGTSTAAFLGVAPRADAPVDSAHVVGNWTEFHDLYVGTADAGTDLSRAVDGFFRNGGGRCYVVNLGRSGSLLGTSTSRGGLALLDAYDDISMVAAPGMTDLASYSALLAHCEDPRHQDRVAILDVPQTLTPDDVERLTRVATAKVGGGAAGHGAGGAADQPDPGAGSGTSGSGDDGLRPPDSQGGRGALYGPWIVVQDQTGGGQVACPPSGHVAGIWARTDTTRGVHKAPANASVLGALGVTYRFSRAEQEVLNPRGVNCIRYFPSDGIMLWGARTLAPQDSEWRYVNVRRLVDMLKEAIADGTRWMVFEPNDATLWRSLRRDVGAFLTQVWSDGALFGATPQEAFFIKCDAETNPRAARDDGQLVAIIGIAPVKPAEFVVFKIMQSADVADVQPMGA